MNYCNEDYADELRSYRHTPNSLEIQLTQLIPEDDVKAILVVEGWDDSVLIIRAFNVVMSGVYAAVIVCGGKYNVLKLRQLLYSDYSSDTKTMFFVDKDHDDFMGVDNTDERTYVTEYYSIEWIICTEEVMCSLIKRYYTLSEMDEIWKVVKARYRSQVKKCLDYLRPVMQAVVVVRKKGKRPKLKKISFSDICRFKDGTVNRTANGINALLGQSGCSTNFSNDDLSQISEEFGSMDDRLYIRGKLYLQFFREFFERLNEVCDRPIKIDGSSLTTSACIGKKGFVDFVGDDWKIPSSLRDFITRWRKRNVT